MKLTNKQLDIIVDDLFERINTSNIQKNKEIEENSSLAAISPEYFKKALEYKELEEEEERLLTRLSALRNKKDDLSRDWKYKVIKGIRLSYYPFSESSLSEFKRKYLISKGLLFEIVDRKTIERKVILSSNSDIKTLIEEILKEFS